MLWTFWCFTRLGFSSTWIRFLRDIRTCAWYLHRTSSEQMVDIWVVRSRCDAKGIKHKWHHRALNYHRFPTGQSGMDASTKMISYRENYKYMNSLKSSLHKRHHQKTDTRPKEWNMNQSFLKYERIQSPHMSQECLIFPPQQFHLRKRAAGSKMNWSPILPAHSTPGMEFKRWPG